MGATVPLRAFLAIISLNLFASTRNYIKHIYSHVNLFLPPGFLALSCSTKEIWLRMDEGVYKAKTAFSKEPETVQPLTAAFCASFGC